MIPPSLEAWIAALVTQGPEPLAWVRLLVIGLAATGAIAGTALALVPPLGRWIAPRPARPTMTDFIPFVRYHGDGLVEARGRWWARVWEIDGCNHQNLSENDLEQLFTARKNTLDKIADCTRADLILHIVSIRSALDGHSHRAAPPDQSLPNALREISARWDHSHQGRLYRNHHYVLAYAHGHHADEVLRDVGDTLSANLDQYGVHPVDGDGPHGPMAIFSRWLSPVSKPTAHCKDSNRIVELCCTDRLGIYPDGRMRFTQGPDERWIAVIGMRAIPEAHKETTAISLLCADVDLTLAFTVRPRSKVIEKTKMAGEMRRNPAIALAGSGGREQTEEAIMVLDDTHPQGLHAEVFTHQITVLVEAPDAETLEQHVRTVRRILNPAGISMIREGILAESLYWGLLPGIDAIARPWRLLTFPVAAAWAPQSAGEGLQHDHWAPHPVTTFRTTQGSAFGFTWHPTTDPEELGHTVVIAPSGAGKTTLLCHLAGQTLRIPRARVWMFDRFQGAEIYTHAMQGDYVRFHTEPNEPAVQLNPLLLPDTPENRHFLRTWIAMLIPGEKTPEDQEAIDRAVRINFDHAAPEAKRLSIIARAAFQPRTDAARHIERWCTGDGKGAMFDADTDSVSSLQQRWTAYDCTRVLADPELSPVLIMYLMYRIQEVSRRAGDPSLVIVDETQPMLGNPTFKEAFSIALREGRKNHQVVVSCFQEADAIEKCGISGTIEATCPTIIFAANPNGTPEHYKPFRLTSGELDFVLHRGHHRHAKYQFLVKRYTGPSAIVDASLKPIGPWLNCHRADTDSIRALRNDIVHHGTANAIERHVRRAHN